MIESVYLLLMIISFILFLVALETESFPIGIMSSVSWLIVFASSLYIEVPGVTDTYIEWTMNAFSLMFIISSVVLSIAFVATWLEDRKRPF